MQGLARHQRLQTFNAKKRFPGLRHRRDGEDLKGVQAIPKAQVPQPPKNPHLAKEMYNPQVLDEMYRNKLMDPSNPHMVKQWVDLPTQRKGRVVFGANNRWRARDGIKDRSPYYSEEYDGERKAAYSYAQQQKAKNVAGVFYPTATPSQAKDDIHADYYMYSGRKGLRKAEMTTARLRGRDNLKTFKEEMYGPKTARGRLQRKK